MGKDQDFNALILGFAIAVNGAIISYYYLSFIYAKSWMIIRLNWLKSSLKSLFELIGKVLFHFHGLETYIR